MRTRTCRIIVTLPSGHELFTVLLTREPVTDELGRGATPPPVFTQPDNPIRPPVPDDQEPRMTEPQKRYLFRLLAAQGVDGKGAEERLRTMFSVRTLREVSKASASQLIEQLLATQREAAHGVA